MVPRKNPALALAVRRLVELGHRRIVMLVREERLKPYPASFEQTFLHELTASGIAVGPYNLPVWEDNRSGFHRCLDSLLELHPRQVCRGRYRRSSAETSLTKASTAEKILDSRHVQALRSLPTTLLKRFDFSPDKD
jgi:hypothetical protein